MEGGVPVKSIVSSSSKSFSSKKTVDSCSAPRLLVLLIVRPNFRLFDSIGREVLAADAFGLKGFCCLGPEAALLTALPSMMALMKDRGDLNARLVAGRTAWARNIGIHREGGAEGDSDELVEIVVVAAMRIEGGSGGPDQT